MLYIGKETLSPDVMLPNLVALITSEVYNTTASSSRRPSSSSLNSLTPDISFKLVALDIMRQLIEEC